MSTNSHASERELLTEKATTPAIVIENLAKLQGDTSISDFVIVCGTQQWPVHRAVLALHSPVLFNASKSGFKEGAERQIDLFEDSPACVGALIKFLYTLKYTEEGEEDDLVFHVRMCVLADKYDVAHLKTIAVAHFKILASKSIKTADFATAAAVAYEAPSATQEIRDFVIEAAIQHKLLVPVDGIESHMASAARTCPDLAVDLMVKMQSDMQTQGAELQEEIRWKCPGCDFEAPDDGVDLDAPFNRGRSAYCSDCSKYTNVRRWRKVLVRRTIFEPGS